MRRFGIASHVSLDDVGDEREGFIKVEDYKLHLQAVWGCKKSLSTVVRLLKSGLV